MGRRRVWRVIGFYDAKSNYRLLPHLSLVCTWPPPVKDEFLSIRRQGWVEGVHSDCGDRLALALYFPGPRIERERPDASAFKTCREGQPLAVRRKRDVRV